MGHISEWLAGNTAIGIAVLLVKTTLMMLAVLILHRFLRRRSAALKHLVLRAGLAGTLLVMVLWVLWPSLQLPMPRFTAEVWTAAVSAIHIDAFTASSPASLPDSPLMRVIFWGWFAIFLVIIGRTAYGIALIRRIITGSVPADSAGLAVSAAAIKDDLNIKSSVQCRISDKTCVPMTWGLWHPTIILPRHSSRWTTDQRDMVLRHEMAHIKRGDILWLNLSVWLTAAYWFHPAAWMIKRILARESEYACDDYVLSAGAGPEEYARYLLQTAQILKDNQASFHAGMAFLKNSELEGRIMSIFTNRKKCLNIKGVWGSFIMSAAILAALFIAGFSLQSCSGDATSQDQAPGTLAPVVDLTSESAHTSPDDGAPVMIYEQNPVYPAAAIEAMIEGKVMIQAFVDNTGVVKKAQISTSSGNELLDAAALDAAWKNRYKPGSVDGQPVGMWVLYSVTFKM